MKRLLWLTLLLPVAAIADELPDTAPAPDAEERSERDMEERFSGGSYMAPSEMDSLFLESPSLLADPESRHGQDARTRKERDEDSRMALTRHMTARQYMQGVQALSEREPEQEPLLEAPLPLLLDDFFDNHLLDEEQRRMFERQAPEQF